jgi:class 3 adenylate cyclase/predicted ATPase
MRCPACAYENRPDARFCEGCGGALARFCGACGAEVGVRGRFCGACGAGLTEPAASPPSPEPAGRRQLTVLFCDLVGSTGLSARLDPEDWREVLGGYQRAAEAVIARYGGHVAQHLGDGLLAYFGWPSAHGDDAERAVRAGLELVDAVAGLDDARTGEERLEVRVGVHTGPVVVSEVGGGAGPSEMLALGETPNVAARVQGEAGAGVVLMSTATQRLVAGLFAVETLGARRLRGVPEPLELLRVVGASGARGRLAAAAARGLSPFVGRDDERRLLRSRFELAREGDGQAVLLVGEPGIGKSRLVQTLRQELAERSEAHVWVECACSPFHVNTPFFAVTELLQQLLAFRGDESPAERLASLERGLARAGQKPVDAVPLIAPLLGVELPEGRFAPLRISAEQERERLLAALAGWVFGFARLQPAVLVIEDLHWVDPSTLALQEILAEQAATAPLLLVYTARPEFRAPWPLRAHHAQLTLARLGKRQVRELVSHVASQAPLSEALLDAVVARTDGVPLFVEELTKTVVEGGASADVRQVPTTLADSLMERLDRLGPAREVAQVASVIGREFSWRLLSAVAGRSDEELRSDLGRLGDAELSFARGLPPEASYVFKHALVQEAAYGSLLRSRRRELHGRIATALTAQLPAIRETQPELLAHHATEAGLHELAVDCWQKAGQRAIERSANLEAIEHLSTGLKILELLPDTPERAQRELTLRNALGMPLRATRGMGAPEVGQVYARAQELCSQVGETPQLFPVLRGLWEFYELQGDLPTAHELAEQLLALAQRIGEVDLLLAAHNVLGDTLIWLGEFASAREHLERGVALYDPEQHRSHAFLYGYDSGVHSLCFLAWALWYLGYPDQAQRRMDEALTLARELSHPYSVAFALGFAAWLHQLRRECSAAREDAEEEIELSIEHGFPLWRVWGTVVRGWALAEQGHFAQGIEQIRQAIAAWRGLGTELQLPYFLALLAEAHAKAGQLDEGMSVLSEALAAVQKAGERQHEAELHRLEGEFLLKQEAPDEREAERCIRKAVEVARQQQAKSFELRAAASLCRLWQQQGKRGEAKELLAPIYGWFTEGFDTADLREARTLLEALA